MESGNLLQKPRSKLTGEIIMKKSLVVGILGLAAHVLSSYGQGTVALNNFSSSIAPHALQDVVFGAGFGALTGTGVGNAYTAGFYYVNVAGDYTADFSFDPTGQANPTSLYSGPGTLTLAVGNGATGQIASLTDTGGAKGEYAPSLSFNPGLGQGATLTMMVIAYNNSSYNFATIRGHSQPFTMVTSVGTAAPELSGNAEHDGGIVFTIPEPSIFALSGVGVAAFMLMRRKK
jgi:hypothetical protein